MSMAFAAYLSFENYVRRSLHVPGLDPALELEEGTMKEGWGSGGVGPRKFFAATLFKLPENVGNAPFASS